MDKPVTADCPALQMPRLALKILEWRKLFHEEEYKLIISKMLNHYIRDVNEYHHRGFKLFFHGYFITKTEVYLVLDIDTKIIVNKPGYIDDYKMIIQDLISNLDKNVRGMIEAIHGANILIGDVITNGDNNTLQVTVTQLFEEFPFNNYPLLKLITGCKEEPGYYDPRLERLKNRISKDRFCSAIFYSAGGCGPVKVGRHDHDKCFDEKQK